jgi:diaphanous 2
LDSKAAQNLSILLGGALKHMPYEQVKLAILRCDMSVMNENIIQQLIQYMPSPDQVQRLEQFRSEYDSLPEAEQFALTVSAKLCVTEPRCFFS